MNFLRMLSRSYSIFHKWCDMGCKYFKKGLQNVVDDSFWPSLIYISRYLCCFFISDIFVFSLRKKTPLLGPYNNSHMKVYLLAVKIV